MLLFFAIVLTIPFVQTKVARIVTNKLNQAYGTEIYVDQVAISVFGGVSLKGVNVLDHHQEDFIHVDYLNTNILDLKKLINGQLYFGDAKAVGIYFRINTYKDEINSSLDVFIESFNDGKESSGKFRLGFNNLDISNSHFEMSNDNLDNNKILDISSLNGKIKDFLVKGSDVNLNILSLNAIDHHGIVVKDLKTLFSYSKNSIVLDKLDLITDESTLNGMIKFNYSENDMKDFINKVKLDFQINKGSISTNDLNHFYNEFGPNKKLHIKTQMSGVLNDFTLRGLKLIDDGKSEIIGYFRFQNIFGTNGRFRMDTNLDRLNSSYYDLVNLLPNVLGEVLPKKLSRLGNISVNGKIGLTKTILDTDINMVTSIGEADVKVKMDNIDNIDNATYKGQLILNKFNLGEIIEDPTFGVVSFDLDLDGRGFSKKYLNTHLVGSINSFVYMGYNYRNVKVNGTMKMPYYKGSLNSNDPNLKLDFDGLIDLSSKVKNYDFTASIDYINLFKLNFVKDSLSVFKGELNLKASGNNLNDLFGEFHIKEAYYQNSKDQYLFEDFILMSTMDHDSVRLISLNSIDAINGQLSGKFEIDQLVSVVENALGSLYTNYLPHEVKQGQYFDFNFSINNKLIEIFLPKLSVGENTKIGGNINADLGNFKLDFSSPGVSVDDIYVSNIDLNVDNKNPLYNAYIAIDSLKTNAYSVSDFNLINVTQNDTLFFRSEFKGGKKGNDFFNLNLYHTIDENNLSILGFQKSEINFKNYLWFLNENDDKNNKVIFNKKLTDFVVQNIELSHNEQIVRLMGVLQDSTYKDLSLVFNHVDLNKITPDIDKLEFGGNINGEVNFQQSGAVFRPSSNISIDKLEINKVVTGDLSLLIEGDENLENFEVSSTIIKDDVEKFYLNGGISVIGKKSFLDLEAGFNQFSLKTISPLLSSIITDIRGDATGKISILGTHTKPEVDGRLLLKDSGMKSAFTGVDYNLDQNTILDLTEEKFILKNVKIIDSKFKTSGILKGEIKHKEFDKWNLDLELTSKNILGLDTKYSEGSVYYGTAFINGTASISGPVDLLSINIDATSNKGTYIRIPINEADGLGDNSFIRFVSAEERNNKLLGIKTELKKYSGIELLFEFVLTPDAVIEIILDRETGHAMKGSGAGFITMEINNHGKFNIWGDFQAYSGEYNFKYGGIIDKKFKVKRYGSLRWDGDPMNAILDLEAIYHTEANPGVIIDNTVLNRKIPTDVSISLTGSLINPEVDFAIDFPNVSTVIKSEIEYKLSDKDTRERQAMALLATGSFFSVENMSSLVYGSFFERASGIFDDLFSDSDDKLKVGLNYTHADRNPYAESQGQVGVTVSTKLSDRISVNGKLGVPVGGVDRSVIVGDVEVLLRLNEDGTLNARVFTKENDINYLGEGIGYTKGVGISYEVDLNTFKEFIIKVLNSAAAKEREKNESDKNHDYEIPNTDNKLLPIQAHLRRRDVDLLQSDL